MGAQRNGYSNEGESEKLRMGDKTRGLYSEGKFIVSRRDGTDQEGGKHDGCRYFVLDLTHDPHAAPALRSYAVSARADGYELLANDLERTVGNAAPALSSRDTEIREVLEGLRSKPNGCWCGLSHLTETTQFEEDGTHDNACLAARALYAKLQGAP